jgi:RecB family exonuclease
MTAPATIRFLAGFCRERPLDDKVFVCPSFVVGRQIGESLAREAGSWINLRFVTPWTLAGEVLERSGRAGAGRPMTSSAELALVDRLFRELYEEGRIGYFGTPERPPSPGLARALHRAVRDLRLAGLAAADIRPERFLVARKGEELALLLGRYERALEEGGLLDAAAFLGSATRAAGETRFGPAWTLCPADSRPSRLERQLVLAAAGDRLVLVPGDPVHGLERPRACWPLPAAGPTPEAERLSWLFDPRNAPAAGGDASIDIFRALGPANECREVLRRLYADKTPFDHVEVLTPAGSAHATIFHLLSARTRLPVTFGDGVPVSFTSPGRLFFGLLDWLSNDFSSAHFCRLLENGDLALRPGPSGTALAARTACRLVRSAMIGWKRERYLPRLRALRESRGADLSLTDKDGGGDEANGDEARRTALTAAIAEIDALESDVERLLGVLPGPDDEDRYDVGALCEALSRIVGERARTDAEPDRKAREALLDRLDEVRRESRSPVLALKEALDLLRATGTSLRVGASPPLPGHLHIAGIATGGHSGRPVTYVLGLDEATFPGRGLQDPVLLDEERTALSDHLSTAADGLRAALFGLAAALASVRGRVVFGYPSFDVVEGRGSFPSSVVLQAFRLMRGDAGLDYGALESGLPEAAGFLPGGAERSFDEIDWWLERLAGSDAAADGPGSIPVHFADLAAGLAAATARAGDRLTEYDGLVDIGPVRADVDPTAGGRAIMSASRLELLARCPFAYFLKHILKVEAPEEVDFDRSRWLDPLQRGSLVHEILCAFMTRIRESGEEVAAARHRGPLAAIAGDLIARMKDEVPPPSEAIFESERRDMFETLAIFLAAEEKREEKGEPFAFEMEIVRQPIDLGAGRSFPLRGTIDRVDRLGPDTYRILDYKTGSPAAYEDLVEFGRGRTIQHALYAVALEGILAGRTGGGRPRVTRSGYFFPSRRGEGLEIVVKDFDRARLRRLLDDLLRLLEKGYFIAGPEAKCAYCDYAPVCGADAPKRTGRKREGSPEVFEAYDRLDEYK